MIEQAKFTYSSLEKVFEKQTKTIENQEEKQIKAIEKNKKQLYNKKQDNNELLLSKERKIFKNIYNKRLNKIDELSKIIDYSDLKLIISSGGTATDFSELKDSVTSLESIRKPEISVDEHAINEKNLIYI